ncbi:MAG TPA: class I tRNA ligase family protein, partial [Methylomirabilota bacterium]|nr:class I tRNA ligase family protein [Methylomirabilota bacterium]
GADTARLFSLFAAPPEKDLDWNDHGVEGAFRFLNRVWRFVTAHLDELAPGPAVAAAATLSPDGRAFRRTIHETIRRVTGDIERDFHFNTAVSAIMELVNALQAFEASTLDRLPAGERRALMCEAVDTLVLLLAPFCPHVTEELWERLGRAGGVVAQRWPEADPAALVKDEVTVVVQVDGKVRSRLTVDVGASEAEVRRQALEDDKVRPWLGARTIDRVVVVPNRLVNIVTRS